MFPIGLLFVALTFGAEIKTAYKDLLQLDLALAKVFSSPLIPGSKPEYAVDNDFLHQSPTCVEHDPRYKDSQDQYWIMIDLGVEYPRVSEIRISDDPSKTSDLSQIEIYLARGLSFSEESVDLELPLSESSIYQENVSRCGVFGSSNRYLSCDQAKSARWVIIKRRGKPLNICLVNVYIEDAHSEIFVKLTPKLIETSQSKGSIPRGIIFRFERNLYVGHCRLECILDSQCQAILQISKRFSSICKLIKNFELSSNEHLPAIELSEKNFDFEENIAHRGKIVPMIPEESLSTSNNSMIKDSFVIKLKVDPVRDKNRVLNSIKLEGTINCNSDKCSVVDIYQKNSENATYCNKIDPTIAKNLEKTLIFCLNDESLKSVSELYLRWRDYDKFDMTKHTLLITGGNVRLTDQHTSLQNDVKMGIEDSILTVTSKSVEENLLLNTTEVDNNSEYSTTELVTSTEHTSTERQKELLSTTRESISTTQSVEIFEKFSQTKDPIDEIIEEGFFNTKRNVDKATTLWLIVGIVAATFISIILFIVVIAYKCSKKPSYDFSIK